MLAASCVVASAQVGVQAPPRLSGSDKDGTAVVRKRFDIKHIDAAHRQMVERALPKHLKYALDRKKGNGTFNAAPKARLVQVNEIDGDKARVTLDVTSDWGDGSGYQLLLDADHMIYDYFYEKATFETIYSSSEYLLPDDAGWLEGFLQAGESFTVDVPDGTYDFVLFNPTPGESETYYPLGDALGDNVHFVGGHEYVFTIDCDGYRDMSTLTTDSDTDIALAGITEPMNGDLTAAEKVTVAVRNVGQAAVSRFTAAYTVNDGTPVEEQVEMEIAPGDTVYYTFKQTADLSEPKVHKIYARVEGEDEALVMNDNAATKYVNKTRPLPAPYTCTFDEEEDVAEWNVIDANNDGRKWNIYVKDGWAVIMTVNPTEAADDYLVTANPVTLDAGKNHISLSYSSYDPSYSESFEVLYGTSPDVEEMTTLQRFENIPYAYRTGHVSAVSFDTPEAGDYYFAIRATSPANQLGIFIYDVTVDNGAFTGTPDLQVDRVDLPVASGALGEETVGVTISNIGSGGVKAFTLECQINGETAMTETFDTEIPGEGTVYVEFAQKADFSEDGTYDVLVTIKDVVPADGQKPEENLDNNSGYAQTTHFAPAELPFVTDFYYEDQRANWTAGDSWAYYDYYYAMYCMGTSPLTSRGVKLEAGKKYRIIYNICAGVDYGTYSYSESYRIIYGPDGKDPMTEWTTLADCKDVLTPGYVDMTADFTVPEDGIYGFGFVQDVTNGSLLLAAVTICEVFPYDVATTELTGMPSMIPTSQLGSMPLSVQVRNMGYETVSGTASFNLLGETVAQEKFTDLAPGDTIYVDLTVNIAETELPTGSGTTETVVAIDGHDDGDPSNNVMPLPLEVTGDTYAYDYMTDDFYTDNGIGAEAGKANLGIVFRIYEETKLKAISLGWGIVTGQDFNMYVYKWDPTGQPDANGNLPLGEQIATASGTQPAEIGQYEYPLDEPLTLEPGYYMISAEYEGFGLAADRIPPGQLYEIGNFNGDGVLVAYDASIAGLGTPAIRAVLDGETTGIETVTDGAESKVKVACDGSTLNVTATDGGLRSVSVYSASGASVMTSAATGGSFSCSLGRLAPGIYFAKVEADGGNVTAKFVVK